jgi:hypothetical protein
MSDRTEDQILRNMGARAKLALDAVDKAVWARSAEIIRRAETLLDTDELTQERAYSLLVSLLEQRKLSTDLDLQVKSGARAARRINLAADRAAEAEEKERDAKLHGRSRFLARTKVPAPPPPVDM